jgi:hypothetical protein
MTTILRKGSASDYISIKQQTAVSSQQPRMKTTAIKGNENFIFSDSSSNCLRYAQSYNLKTSFTKGQLNCCDISNNIGK